METVCQVPFNLMTSDEERRAEPILREYLLRTADQIAMKRVGSSDVSLFTLWPSFSGAKKFKKMLMPDDLVSENEHEWTFNLTENIKNYLNKATLFLTDKKLFTGLTDIKFTKKGNELAYMTISDKLLDLYIPDSDKAELSSQGVYLDSPQM